MMSTLWLVVCAIGGAVVVALALVYRRARAHRELELAERLLDEE